MKYISVDLETTCLDPNPKNILMIAMVVEDTKTKLPLNELPRFVCLVKRPIYSGTPYALTLNSWILEMLANNDTSKYPIYEESEWVSKAAAFIDEHFKDTKAVPAGKNFSSFDLQFFPDTIKRKFMRRAIDPGSMFVDWEKEAPLSLDDIKKHLCIPGEVTHDAVEDALDVIKVLRTQY
jgi:oligoribonuclease (3'-5' exoribonuclease)